MTRGCEAAAAAAATRSMRSLSARSTVEQISFPAQILQVGGRRSSIEVHVGAREAVGGRAATAKRAGPVPRVAVGSLDERRL